MSFNKLLRRYYGLELTTINRYFPFINKEMEDISILPLKLIAGSLDVYYDHSVNLCQNTNLSFRSVGSDITKVTLNLEKLVKHCKSNIFDERDRQLIRIENVITYIFFTDINGNVVNVYDYIKRIKSAIFFLLDYFIKHRNEQGTQAYAICRTIYMHLEYMYIFVNDLAHIFLDKSIK